MANAGRKREGENGVSVGSETQSLDLHLGQQTVVAPQMFYLPFRNMLNGVRWRYQITYQDGVDFALDRLSVGKTRKIYCIVAKICFKWSSVPRVCSSMEWFGME